MTTAISNQTVQLLTFELATEKLWVYPFQGDAHLKLRDTIMHMNQERMPTQAYANMMSIIQSSGTGKSRLVDKLAEVVFTLPFNLRDPKEDECRFLLCSYAHHSDIQPIAGAFPHPIPRSIGSLWNQHWEILNMMSERVIAPYRALRESPEHTTQPR